MDQRKKTPDRQKKTLSNKASDAYMYLSVAPTLKPSIRMQFEAECMSALTCVNTDRLNGSTLVPPGCVTNVKVFVVSE
jgi:hypothetical protein